jgi:hypothetical protein
MGGNPSPNRRQTLMPFAALLTLRVLILAEPAITVAALAAYIRPGRGLHLPAMRDYLIARLVLCVFDLGTLAGPHSVFPAVTSWTAEYFFAWWCGSLVLAFLLFRVAGEALQITLRPLPGLRALNTIAWRWLLIASVLLLVPAAISSGMSILHTGRSVGPLSLSAALSLAELLPLAFALLMGFRLGLSLRSRLFGVLAGLAIEPAASFLTVWFYNHGIWAWGNLVRQSATTATLLIWTCWFLLPVETTRFAALRGMLVRLDAAAQTVLRRRTPAESPAPGRAPAHTSAPGAWYAQSKRPDSRESGPARSLR